MAHFRNKIYRNQGNQWNANQHHEYALDRKDITQFADDGGEDSAGAEGQSHHQAGHHGAAPGRYFLGHHHAQGQGSHVKAAGQDRCRIDPPMGSHQKQKQKRGHETVGNPQQSFVAHPVRKMTADNAGHRPRKGEHGKQDARTNDGIAFLHPQHRHKSQQRLTHQRSHDHRDPDQQDRLPDTAQGLPEGFQKAILGHALPPGFRNDPIKIDPDQKADNHGRRHGAETEPRHVPSDEDGPQPEGQGAGGVIDGHGQSGVAAGIQRHHARDRRMKQ